MSGTYYDLSTYEEADEDSVLPPTANLLAAACYIKDLLSQQDLLCAAQGGLAMLCRGSSRTTADVNVATDASMKQLWQVLEPTPGQVPARLKIPNTRLLDKVVRVFVKTGPAYGDTWCTENTEVEVDLNVFGGHRVSMDLATHIETIELKYQDISFQIQVLDIAYMMRTKLRTLTSRGAQKDFEDAEYLVMCYADQIKAIAGQLDLQDRAHFFNTEHVQSNHPLTVGLYRTVLEL